jgi:hypothetical protein
MALLKGHREHRSTAGTPEPEPTAQFKAIDLADAIADPDRAGLERLDAAGRAEQERIRLALWEGSDTGEPRRILR